MSSRPYLHPQDQDLVLDFVRAVRPLARYHDYPNLVDLEELLPLAEIQARIRLWLDQAENLVAFAFVDPFDNLWFEVEPARETALGAEIVAFGIEGRRSGLEDGETGSLETNCAADNTPRREFLLSQGFLPLSEETLLLERSLRDPIPAPQLPPGFQIRPVAGEGEAEAVATLHRAAFGTDYMTTENRLALMRTSEYDPEMDLVAVAPDGQLAAYLMGSIASAENERTGQKVGSTDPIATHPNFQRLGLARALLLTGLQMLKERGMELARLGTSSENPAMQTAAEAVGFVVTSRNIWFQKTV